MPMIMNMSTNTNMKLTKIKLCSLNCRSLSKPSMIETSQSFSRFLRTKDLDILCLQETHAATLEFQERLNMQLQSNEAIWSQHCGIVSLNPSIELEPIYTSDDERVITCKISHISNHFPPFIIMNIYAPASNIARYNFYAQLLQQPCFNWMLNVMTDTSEFLQSSDPYTIDTPAFIVGDFNYNSKHFPAALMSDVTQLDTSFLHTDYNLSSTIQTAFDPEETPADIQTESSDPTTLPPLSRSQWLWHALLLRYFNETTHKLTTRPQPPTFRRGSNKTTIDYIFAAPHLVEFVSNSDIEFISNVWTDHALLSITLQFRCAEHGKGLWRANPALAQNPYFINKLYAALNDFHNQIEQNPTERQPSPQELWDQIKSLTRQVALRCSRSKAEWRHRQLKRLQRKRNKLIRQYHLHDTALNQRLPVVEKLIGDLQQEVADIQALRAGIRWRENGEVSAGFLKRTATRRAIKRTIPTLVHPITHDQCDTNDQKCAAASTFYKYLYSPAPVNQDDIHYFANLIPPESRIPDEHYDLLCAPFTIDDLNDSSLRKPKKSSPGIDGLPYEIYNILFDHDRTADLALDMFNDALEKGIFPASWQETCLILLPKSQHLESLTQWRPISLIAVDAKIFTRLLNARLMMVLSTRISSHQLGFMPKRFIGENGMLLQTIQSIATDTNSDSIALLLDQEKAYDRVHFEYLRAMMKAFNLPDSIIHTLITLFSNTQIRINVNGFLTEPFSQQRGLRQGDPISPLLFNIAFDPFLRAIHNSSNFKGFDFGKATASSPPSNHIAQVTNLLDNLTIHNSPSMIHTTNNPPPIKVIAYADDTLVLLKDHEDYHELECTISKYMTASNASLNLSKTKAISLSGQVHLEWKQYLSTKGIASWHDKKSTEPLIYLGYPICSSKLQQANFANSIISQLRQYCQQHVQRNLTLRGRATILNSLLYSKIWHVMRIFTFTKAQLHTLQQIGASFINKNVKVTRFSFRTLTLPRNKGGLNLIDPAVQACALQWRWLRALLDPALKVPSFMVSLPYIQFTLNHFLSSSIYPSYHWSLLFPSCRPATSNNAIQTIITNLFRAVDNIQRNFHHCNADIATCLRLPITELFLSRLPDRHPSSATFVPPSQLLQPYPTMKTLIGADIMYYNQHFHALKLHNSFNTLLHKVSSKRAIDLINNQQLLFQPFVLYNLLQVAPRSINSFPASLPDYETNITMLSSFLTSIISLQYSFLDHSFTLANDTIKAYKLLPLQTTTNPSTPFPPFSRWAEFWSLQIPLNARNTWYRIIHNKITTRKKLNLCNPDVFTPNCPLCKRRRYNRQPTIETHDHFLFNCPLKYEVWSSALAHYISPLLFSVTITEYHNLLFMTSPFTTLSPHCSYQQLSVYQVFSCIQQAIWHFHYRQVFQNVPFTPHTVLAYIDRSLNTLSSQLSLSSMI